MSFIQITLEIIKRFTKEKIWFYDGIIKHTMIIFRNMRKSNS